MRSSRAASNKNAVTRKAEIMPGLTVFKPSRSIWFKLCSTASRMVSCTLSERPGDPVSSAPASSSRIAATHSARAFLCCFIQHSFFRFL